MNAHGRDAGWRGFAVLCTNLGVTWSMVAVGASADGALAESFNATFRRETLQGAGLWTTPHAARLAVFTWVTRYNLRRMFPAGRIAKTYDFADINSALVDSESGAVVKPLLVF